MPVFAALSLGRHAVGIICVLLVVVLWVSSSELTQSIFQNKNYNHPFFLTYFNTGLFMIYIPFFSRLFINWIKWNGMQKVNANDGNSGNTSEYSVLSLAADDSSSKSLSAKPESEKKLQYNSTLTDSDASDKSTKSDANHNNNKEIIANNDRNLILIDNDGSEINASEKCLDKLCIPALGSEQFTFIQTGKLSAMFCPIWFLMNYTFNASLDKTSVASNTILSTMSGPFSLMLSYCFLKTKFTGWNVAGVFVVVVGAVFIGYLDNQSSTSDDTIFGDILTLVSALIYGTYVTLVKYKLGDESKTNMFLFFSLIGMINICTLWPIIIILHLSKIESFEWPESDVLALLTINGLISVFSDYFWAQAILLTSPVVATVGLSLMMPAAMIADEIFRQETHNFWYWMGAILVAVGFIFVNLDFEKNEIKSETRPEIGNEDDDDSNHNND